MVPQRGVWTIFDKTIHGIYYYLLRILVLLGFATFGLIGVIEELFLLEFTLAFMILLNKGIEFIDEHFLLILREANDSLKLTYKAVVYFCWFLIGYIDIHAVSRFVSSNNHVPSGILLAIYF